MTPPAHDAPARIRASWDRNAEAWIHAVRGRRIESRRAATDAAMVAAVRARAPARVLDVGCGEGWLCRALAGAGIDAIGIDGSAALVAAALDTGVRAHHVDYDALAREPLVLGRFDAAACNFSLFERDLRPLLSALASLLRPAGTLLVQTVHPDTSGDDDDGWREENFAPLGPGFASPMPWYRHGPHAWRRQLADAGFTAVHATPVHHPHSGAPLSVILRATPDAERARC